MTAGPIIVINPNSNRAVTTGLNEALEAFRLPRGPAIECLTLEEGPFGIESQLHVEQVVLPLVRLAEARADASAIVIACYADPGIDALRSITRVPIFGIQESGVLAALARGDRIGIVAVSEASIPRHIRYMRRMGVLDRVAGDRPLNMTVDETARGERTFERLMEVGGRLLEDGANALVLGCAGMARHRAPLESELGVPVIEPTQAAVGMALGTVLAGMQAQPAPHARSRKVPEAAK